MKPIARDGEGRAMRRNASEIRAAIRELKELREDMLKLEGRVALRHRELRSSQRKSAANLLDYLALRGHDLRRLQSRLASIGVSSLGRSEAHVKEDVERVLAILNRLQRSASMPAISPKTDGAVPLLAHRTEELLGPSSPGRHVRIMVTAPSEAATNYDLVLRLLQHGMNCLRINCAYDNPEAWARMIANLKQAREELGKPCTVLMDIAGPKLRLGPIERGPRVIKIRPKRDEFGRVLRPARVWLTPAENRVQAPGGADGSLQITANWLKRCSPGDIIHFSDARGSRRKMKIVAAEGPNRWAELEKTSYIVPETELHLHRGAQSRVSGKSARHLVPARPVDIPALEQSLFLLPGDTLMLTRMFAPGHPAKYDDQHHLLSPATASLTLPEVFDQVRAGEVIWFDDGRLGGIVRTVDADAISVEITHAPPEGRTLEGNKGINLPDTDLHLPAVTSQDQRALEFIVKNADMVGYSFVRDEHGVRELQRRIANLGGHLGIVLKIETRKAFECLPDLLLATMSGGPVGVMIARGDLAIECGFERLAEVQEEILWFAEAAHVPVIWATQVLERLAKSGVPSRAEITDAAMAGRAECVMLNKGPFIVDAVCSLDDILRRMETHQTKKGCMLRSLKLARNYGVGGPAEASVPGNAQRRVRLGKCKRTSNKIAISANSPRITPIPPRPETMTRSAA